MPRPQRCRRICAEPDYDIFSPGGCAGGGTVILTVDEYEALRLIDLEKLTHEQCAARMEVSRTTVTEIYESARRKVADCLVNGKELHIFGGNYRLCDGTAGCCHRQTCRCGEENARGTAGLTEKGAEEMRIAVTYEDGVVFQHFGHTEQFKLYDIEDGRVVREQIAPTLGSGHGALAGFLLEQGVDTLICGGIGGGAQNALAQAGIRLYGGVSGSADEAVQALLHGTLGYDPEVHCDHHSHGHGEGHSCGEHTCQEHQ